MGRWDGERVGRLYLASWVDGTHPWPKNRWSVVGFELRFKVSIVRQNVATTATTPASGTSSLGS